MSPIGQHILTLFVEVTVGALGFVAAWGLWKQVAQ